MKKIVVSAPGKLHLSGEHAVVYGKPALVVSTSRRLYVTIETQNSELPSKRDLASRDRTQKLAKLQEKDAYINAIVKIVEEKYKTQIKNVWVRINSDIPTGAGMGSSAAVAVALIGALTQYLGKPWNATEINELAFEAEKTKHGNSSGSDPTIVVHGGLLWYRKEFEFLKTFWLLPFKIPQAFLSFMLINTGREESLVELIGSGRRLKKRNEQAFDRLLLDIEKVTKKIVVAIKVRDRVAFCEGIRENQRLLEKMGIVSVSVQRFIREIEQIGGVAKISGAGGIKKGSGIVMATHKHLKTIIDIAQKYGFPHFQTEWGGEGVRIERAIT